MKLYLAWIIVVAAVLIVLWFVGCAVYILVKNWKQECTEAAVIITTILSVSLALTWALIYLAEHYNH